MTSRLPSFRDCIEALVGIGGIVIASACHTVPETSPRQCAGMTYLAVLNNTVTPVDLVATTSLGSTTILGTVDAQSSGEFVVPDGTRQTFFRPAGAAQGGVPDAKLIQTRYICR
jgi:hypothetical protein